MKYRLSTTLSALVVLVHVACNTGGSAIQPVHKDLVQAIYASGKIFPYNHVFIAAKVNGYASKVLVKTGDVVKAGTPLVLLSAPGSDVNIDIAQTNLQLSQANNADNMNQLNAALQDIQSAYAKYQLDSTSYERYKNLWNENITTRQSVDQAKTQADLAWQNYLKAKSVYSNLKTKLSTDVSLAEQQLALQKISKSDYVITAPYDGKVYDVPVKEGQLVTAGTVAIEFGDPVKFEAELDVDETDIGMLQISQRVLLSMDAYPEQPVYTVIREILPGVSQGTRTTTVKADMPADSLRLFSGMSTEANIIVSTKKNVLVIPVEYLASDNTVLTAEGKKLPVKTGIRDMEHVEIISGIDTTTQLKKP